MRRRDFIVGLGGAAAWLRPALAQPAAIPVVALINNGSEEASPRFRTAFRAGLAESGYIEGRNVSVEYHWLEGQLRQVSALVADLVRRRVAVIATPGFTSASTAAKAATKAIPVVFGVGENPVSLGLVASFARPGGNATGVNFLMQEILPKVLGLLHNLTPNADRIAVLVNPATTKETQEREWDTVQEAARALGLVTDLVHATNSREIEQGFDTMARDGANALFILPDGYFASRRVQLATFAARHGIPAAYVDRAFPEAGGLMSYGADLADMFHQVGAYAGQILKGVKPADLPVVQPTRFEFVINMQTARLLGIEVPATLLAIADKVID